MISQGDEIRADWQRISQRRCFLHEKGSTAKHKFATKPAAVGLDDVHDWLEFDRRVVLNVFVLRPMTILAGVVAPLNVRGWCTWSSLLTRRHFSQALSLVLELGWTKTWLSGVELTVGCCFQVWASTWVRFDCCGCWGCSGCSGWIPRRSLFKINL